MRLTVAIALGAFAMLVAQTKGQKLTSQKDQVSYSIGVNIGQNFKVQGVDLDLNLVTKGIKDALAGAKLQMTEEEMTECMNKFQTEMMSKQQERQQVEGGKNLQEGEKFLTENKKKEGVLTTASGLQYKVLKMGTGAKPKATDAVEVNYRGTTIDGKEFDSSYKHGQTSTFKLSEVVKGWTEGMQLMPIGSKFQFFIPPSLGWGERGAGPDIGPNAVVLFEVELVSIK